MQINLMPDYSLLAIMAIFIVNYLIVRAFFLKPINAVLEARETDIRTAEKVYEESMARFSDATTKMEEQLHAAKRDAAQLRDRFRGEAGAFRQQTLDRTGAQAKQIVSEADAKLSGDVAVARETIVRDAESLARLAAERILGRAV